jgi:Leucine-rich repeat (LRR) protein
MRLVFRFIFYFLSIILLIQCERNEPNPQLTINDKNFLYALIALGIDTNGDGQISNAEAKTVISLDVSQNNISDMKGIEKFVNLDTLNCRDNDLTTLDVTNNTALKYLDCTYNELTTLDISLNTALVCLDCRVNGLTTLDVSKNIALEHMDCARNLLTTLDVSKNTALHFLTCSDNKLTTLDVSNLPDLWVLSCSGNQMSSLNISNNPDLGPFTGMTVLDISNMPSLHEVCVLTMPFPPEGVEIDTTGSPNVYFTIECSD